MTVLRLPHAETQRPESASQSVSEAQNLLTTTELPEGRSQRLTNCLPLLLPCLMICWNRIQRLRWERRAEGVTAKGSPEYFKQIAAMRKERKGGRPPKNVQ
jgi:hypothetical protein